MTPELVLLVKASWTKLIPARERAATALAVAA